MPTVTEAAAVRSQSAPAKVQPKPKTRPTVSYPVGCSNYLNYFRQYNWNVSVAVAICQAESRGNPYALSYTGDRGLMQINWVHSDMVGGNLSLLYDPATNIRVAYQVYSGAGWYAWTTYTSGRYLSYL